jgi:hypothetical protein
VSPPDELGAEAECRRHSAPCVDHNQQEVSWRAAAAAVHSCELILSRLVRKPQYAEVRDLKRSVPRTAR